MSLLDGKLAIVTGAGRGIGRAISAELAMHGATVLGVARSADALEEVRAAIANAGRGTFVPIPLDVTSEGQVRDAFALAEGYGPIDIVINNAGIGNPGALLDISLADWEEQMAVNARGMFLFTREAARVMVPRKRGDIINVSSAAGKRAVPGFAAYTASKFAAVGFTEAIARELRKAGIRVTSVCPGAVATDLRRAAAPEEDAARITQPDQIASLIALLLTAGLSMRDMAIDIF